MPPFMEQNVNWSFLRKNSRFADNISFRADDGLLVDDSNSHNSTHVSSTLARSDILLTWSECNFF